MFRFVFSIIICVLTPFCVTAELLYPLEMVNRSDSRLLRVDAAGAAVLRMAPLRGGSFRVYPIASGRVIRRSSRELAIAHDSVAGQTVYRNFETRQFKQGDSVSASTLLGNAGSALFLANEISPPDALLKTRVIRHIPDIAVLNPCVDENHVSMVTPVVKIAEKLFESHISVVHYRKLAQCDLNGFDAVIVTGQSSPWEHYDMNDFREFKTLLDKGRVPVLGICGGHQLIALLYGAPVGLIRDSCDKTQGYGGCFKLRGPVEVEILEAGSIFYGQPATRMFFASHCEEVKRLPDGFVLTARNGVSSIYAMRHVAKPQYSVQFHPELGGIEDSERVIEEFLFIACNRMW